VALGNGENHGVFHGACVELGGADQVAHVFQYAQIQLLGAHSFKSLCGHARVQVAHAAGVELNDLGAGLFNGGGVHVGINIGLHDADIHLVLQRGDGGLKRGGLAASGGGHEIQQERVLTLELFSQFIGFLVVVGKDAFLDFEYFVSFHIMHLVF